MQVKFKLVETFADKFQTHILLRMFLLGGIFLANI